jgi:hypothetical protein
VLVGKALNLEGIGVTGFVFVCGIRFVPSLFVVAGRLKRLKRKESRESFERSTSDCAYNGGYGASFSKMVY